MQFVHRTWIASAAALLLGVSISSTPATAQQRAANPPEPVQRIARSQSFAMQDAMQDELDRPLIPCPTDEENRMQFKRLTDIDLELYAQDRELPPDCSQSVFLGTQPATRRFDSIQTVTWAPTNLFHQPLYFDDVPLEQYGQSLCPHFQPILSGARFFLTVPAIPYKIGVDHPFDCVTTLGYYRSGNCAPCMKEVLPLEGDAALLQAGTTVALIFLLP